MTLSQRLAAPATGKIEAIAKALFWGIVANPAIWLIGYYLAMGGRL